MQLGLVGHPVAHSLSPRLHEAALRHAGIEGSYALFDVADGATLAALWERLRRGELDGLNVTVPHKLAAYAACTRRSPVAESVGAVNTLVRDAGELVGWNTDLPGLVASIREAWTTDLGGRSALVIGAGGAAPAAVLAARQLGAGDVRVWNRTSARAEALVARLGVGTAVTDRVDGARDVSLVLHASSHGMGLDGAAFEVAVAEASEVLATTPADARVVDLVYTPQHARGTVWVCAAHRLGRDAIDGLGMLVHQAALAFELWTGKRSEVDADARASAPLVAAMRASLSVLAD